MRSNTKQPEPGAKSYEDLIGYIEKGVIKIPKFQRDFIWSIEDTAKLLDSIVKGYPIGTFILWRTNERMNDIKNVGNIDIPATPDGMMVEYVLDGQQRITSLFAAYRGAHIERDGGKKTTDYKSIYVNLDQNEQESDEQVITAKPPNGKFISLYEVLNFDYYMSTELEDSYSRDEIGIIASYNMSFKTYKFSTVVLEESEIDLAIEVFMRINTSGQDLTLFEIMSAKTYDEKLEFDMQQKWESLIEELNNVQYETISNITILRLITLLLSRTKECKRKNILSLEKKAIIKIWDEAISALKHSIDYFKTAYRIPVSQLLPYDVLLVAFAYFFFKNKNEPNSLQSKYLKEYFWRMSLSYRYSGSVDTNLAQDIRRIDLILNQQRPDYKDVKISVDPQELIDTEFSTGSSYCKAILCLLAYQEPKDFHNDGKVNLDNAWLKIASSKNYHHFFPKKFLKDSGIQNSNSLMNITFVSANLNKSLIRAKPPSKYIAEFQISNNDIAVTLKTHLIELNDFGIQNDDYEAFLNARANNIFRELDARINI